MNYLTIMWCSIGWQDGVFNPINSLHFLVQIFAKYIGPLNYPELLLVWKVKD